MGYTVNLMEQVRQAYLNLGPFQIKLAKYKNKEVSILLSSNIPVSVFFLVGYSPTTHSTYCYPCYLFNDKQSVRNGKDALTIKGFDNWKRVNGKECAFLKHVDSAQHRNAMVYSEKLLNQDAHIENIISKRDKEEIEKNRLRLTTIDAVRWLTYQACSLLGHDESSKSKSHVNTVYGSKRHDELQKAKEIIELIELGEIKIVKGLNQVGTLRRAGVTPWGSHYQLEGYVNLKSFDFVFILHLIKEVMGRTEILSYSLQKKSQYILNAIKLYRPRKKDNQVTFEHYYQVDHFKATVEKQLHELNARFNDQTMKLLNVSSTLVLKKDPKVIDVDQICLLVEKYYPEDFMKQERIQLRVQLNSFNFHMPNNPKLSGASSIVDLCKGLANTQLHDEYYLLDRVIRLILTLPVSIATTERGFSPMKIFKNSLCNKIFDDYLANNLMIYIEKGLAESFDSASVIDEFTELKGHRAKL
ncbi:uncharacterized protein LOC143535733 [Bidens hawaiensis]|uniref:uncharacterized protein LOC143535733 n=1 Tax=Bidens hawaiensis TaxID=980011 RepID=UPI004049ADE0